MIARNKYVAHRARSAADAAWEDYRTALAAMFPRVEAEKILDALRDKHVARWRRIDQALMRVRQRRITEDDIE